MSQVRTVDALWSAIGQLLERFGSAECEHYIRHCGYCQSRCSALAVTSGTRVPLAPNIPTMQEAGVTGYISRAFIGVTVPAHTPPGIIERLHKETARIMVMPDVVDRIVNMGMVPSPTTSQEYVGFLRRETERNRKLIKDAKLQLDS